ncbi:hypothetical protein QR680_015907 [Steinernema hermaphroditum]|uniref:Uncharacterized protein n=1 Tax=Steinernema hermaphroditum TaxID=289476 RepID=A0AA39HB93_9BILA|nr:hypothetical protein QR680_015907 [Steinernema hermaphroditum]
MFLLGLISVGNVEVDQIRFVFRRVKLNLRKLAKTSRATMLNNVRLILLMLRLVLLADVEHNQVFLLFRRNLFNMNETIAIVSTFDFDLLS